MVVAVAVVVVVVVVVVVIMRRMIVTEDECPIGVMPLGDFLQCNVWSGLQGQSSETVIRRGARNQPLPISMPSVIRPAASTSHRVAVA